MPDLEKLEKDGHYDRNRDLVLQLIKSPDCFAYEIDRCYWDVLRTIADKNSYQIVRNQEMTNFFALNNSIARGLTNDCLGMAVESFKRSPYVEN